jgi:Putative lumazine-binding
MKKIFFIVLMCCISFFAPAQSATDSIKTIINDLFVAMKNSDGDGITKCFADGAILQTITKNKEEKTIVETDSIAAFARIVKSMAKGDGDEKVVFDAIHIDRPMAAVWAPYEFYYKGQFSHCGVDHFVMIWQEGQWRIQYLIDTRKKQGCKE